MIMRTPWIIAMSILCLAVTRAGQAQVVPGSGTKLDKVGDDFEDPAWKFIAETHPERGKIAGDKARKDIERSAALSIQNFRLQYRRGGVRNIKYMKTSASGDIRVVA